MSSPAVPSRARRLGFTVGAVLLAGALGAGVGWAAGSSRDTDPVVTVDTAEPIPAVHPSVPVFRKYNKDIDYPPLATNLTYVGKEIGNRPYRWAYSVPEGWVPTASGMDEVKWRPAGEPTAGGYFVRVKLINNHLTPSEMVEAKLDAFMSSYDDVAVYTKAWNTLGVTYREPTLNVKRWNVFRWITPKGDDEAQFEMSVGGRQVDQAGLEDLLTKVSASVHRLE